MHADLLNKLPEFLVALGLDETPNLKIETWSAVRKKIDRSKRTWGELNG